MSTLILDDVSKIYGKDTRRSVDGVSMSIKDGEIIALLGSSGCGKTSTLRMIAGFEDVTSGTIRIGDKVVNDLKPSERDVAMAFEGYALYPPLRVRENIAFSLLKNRTPRAEIDKRVGAVSDMLEIGPLLDKYPPSLSGGQQQRVSLARAMVRNASAFLLDEPMSQLEPQLRALLRARIKDHMTAHRMTTVIVTHDQTEAIALSDRVAVMDKGLLQQFGTPDDLRERPANLFVASFIGEPPMNIFPGARTENGVVVLNERGEAAFGIAGATGGLSAHDGLHVGIRPHRIHVGGGVPGAETVQGEVLSSHWLGDHSHIGLSVGGCFLIAVGDRDATPPAGSVVPVSIPRDAVHLFDSASGAAIQHGL
ncbi:ABC transporter ATP-binding protein [Rhizosaccharibacter radicis]|uniref:ABC transporter ATP-binding protein n=1 Tax=Rhizosaccharibacter radicis TaxID=2782605 RepID=A0ABT1VSP1_9PROT|nr:ABC transporter ATP-binding protein [Acetobacteraceae bacterium KSS12]